MRFWYCVIYLAVVGILCFIAGRLLPKRWFHGDRWPYRSFAFEQEGAVYQKLGIKKWQNRIPDMSRILPMVMPAKSFQIGEEERLPRMIQETCVAELIHVVLQVLGLACIRIWQGAGGIVVAVLYWIGNIPFILVQRYNRPRLIKILNKKNSIKYDNRERNATA